MKEGPANRSYGLQVAQLAGVPREVIARAREYLTALESERHAGLDHQAQPQLPLFANATSEADELIAELAALNPDELSPKAALDALYRLRARLKST